MSPHHGHLAAADDNCHHGHDGDDDHLRTHDDDSQGAAKLSEIHGAVPDREPVSDREAVPQPVQGGAADPFTAAARPARPQLEVFQRADVRERERWDDYQKDFSETRSNTSADWAPWYVIPADRKWFARIGAGAVPLPTLIEIDPRFPRITSDWRDTLLDAKGIPAEQTPKGTSTAAAISSCWSSASSTAAGSVPVAWRARLIRDGGQHLGDYRASPLAAAIAW